MEIPTNPANRASPETTTSNTVRDAGIQDRYQKLLFVLASIEIASRLQIHKLIDLTYGKRNPDWLTFSSTL
jgi:hypothetical protein